MCADFTKELPSSWNQDDVQKWKKTALDALKAYYLGFSGSQWNEFDRSTDTMLLRAQICFALYGNPTKDAGNIENAYEECQRKKGGEILEVILKVRIDFESSFAFKMFSSYRSRRTTLAISGVHSPILSQYFGIIAS